MPYNPMQFIAVIGYCSDYFLEEIEIKNKYGSLTLVNIYKA